MTWRSAGDRTASRRASRIPDEGLDIGHDARAPFVGARVVQVGAEPLDALLHTSGRAPELAQDSVHLAFDAAHFAQAQLVDFRGRHVGAGELLQPVGVDFGPLFKPPESRVVGGLRQLRLEQRDRLSPHRIDLGVDNPGGLVTQLLPLLHRQFRYAAHPVGERGDQRVLPGGRRHELSHLRNGGPQDESRREDAPAREPSRFFDGLREPVVHRPQPGQVVSRVVLGEDRVHHGHQVGQSYVRAAELLQRKIVVAERLAFRDDLQLPLHDVGRHTLPCRSSATGRTARQLLSIRGAPARLCLA